MCDLKMKILEFIGGDIGLAAMRHLKYWSMKTASDDIDHKADIQTLFDGEK